MSIWGRRGEGGGVTAYSAFFIVFDLALGQFAHASVADARSIDVGQVQTLPLGQFQNALAWRTPI